MTQVHKILHSSTDTCQSKVFELSTTISTRGYNFKFKKLRCRLNCSKHFFSNRVIGVWNSLPSEIVNSDTVNTFKLRV